MSPEERRDQECRALLRRAGALLDAPAHRHGGWTVSCRSVLRDPITGGRVPALVIGSADDQGTSGRLPASVVFDLGRLETLCRNGSASAVDERFAALYRACLITGPEDVAAAPTSFPTAVQVAVHALAPGRHVDQVRTTAIDAIARSRDADRLVHECYGADVAWLSPTSTLLASIRGILASADASPLKGFVLSGGELVCWSDSSAACAEVTAALVERADRFVAGRTTPAPAVPRQADDGERCAATLGPALRGLTSGGRPSVGHFTDDDRALAFMADAFFERRLGSRPPGYPDHGPFVELVLSDRDLAAPGLEDLRRRYADHLDRPGIDDRTPVVVLVPRVGLWCFGPDAAGARRACEEYVRLLDVLRLTDQMSGPPPATASSDVPAERLLRHRPRPVPPGGVLRGRVAMVTGAASGIGRAIAKRLGGAGAAVVAADIDDQGLADLVKELGGADAATAVIVDLEDEDAVEAAVRSACLAYGGLDLVVNNAGLSVSAPLLTTTAADWDRQHRVMARGSFLVSRAATAVMRTQGLPGDIVYIASKNAVAAGANNVAYGAAKADQEHQVRLLAVELGQYGIRVNGVNPDGITRDSGIFRGEWGDRRAQAYGVERADLGSFYAARTLLGKEVLPKHVADAVLVLVGDQLSRTTGTIVPVDGGIAAAFLR